jgi:hypothetical protein
MRVHGVVSCGRLMQYACGSVNFASPLIFFYGGSCNSDTPGTFRYHLVHIIQAVSILEIGSEEVSGLAVKWNFMKIYMWSSDSIYTVFRVQADWTFILPSATSCEGTVPLAEKNATAQLELLAHIVYFFC